MERGDIIIVTKPVDGSPYREGDIFEVAMVHYFSDGDIYQASNGMQFYDHEVERYRAPRDYEEETMETPEEDRTDHSLEYESLGDAWSRASAAEAKDVAVDPELHLDAEQEAHYRDVVTSMTQAIERASKRMREANGLQYGIKHESTIESDVEKTDLEFPGWGEDVGREVIYDTYNPDAVKAPAHYVNSRIEPIEYMADKLPAYEDGYTAFCVGNVIKYVSRAPHKGTFLQDLKKARQYLDFAIEHEEKKLK